MTPTRRPADLGFDIGGMPSVDTSADPRQGDRHRACHPEAMAAVAVAVYGIVAMRAAQSAGASPAMTWSCNRVTASRVPGRRPQP